MQNIDSLKLTPQVKPVKALQPGDFIEVPHGRKTVYRQVFGVPSVQGSSATLKMLRYADFKPIGRTQFYVDASVNVVPKEALEAALEQQVLDVLRPGVAGKTVDSLFRAVRDRLRDSPGRKRVELVCKTLAERGLLLEKELQYRSNRYMPHYRQFLSGCSLPNLVYHTQHHQVGWLVGFEDRYPQPHPYPVVKWFNGRVELSHEKFLEPVDDDRTIRGVRQAIAYRHGIVGENFVEIPQSLLEDLCGGRSCNSGLRSNGSKIIEIARFLQQEFEDFPGSITPKEATLQYLDQHYSGWRQGVIPQELMTDPPEGF